MPYQSQAQRAYMFMHHPAIAKEWAAKYGGGGKNLPYHKGEVGGHGKAKLNMTPTGTSSEESPNPHIQKLPRIPGMKRDFGGLHPSTSARFKPANKAIPNEHEAMSQAPLEHFPGSRHHKMPSIRPYSDTHLSMRDLRVANRKTITPLNHYYRK